MPEASREKPLDFEGLADFLSALSYPARLELLHILRFPHTLGEIDLPARRGGTPDRPEHPASRPAIYAHLEKLEAADLVRTEPFQQGGRSLNRYAVNSLKLYELLEELRRVCVVHAGRGPAGDATGTVTATAPPAAAHGPRLMLVHGLYEGKSFFLEEGTEHEGRWLIGRRKGLPVSLDYDPYVSTENAAVTVEDGAYFVEDLGSKNGTTLDWVPLPKSGVRQLRPGNVLGVGRSLLSFAVE
jgi:DNA-binding transcriptional ArsR family regulator